MFKVNFNSISWVLLFCEHNVAKHFFYMEEFRVKKCSAFSKLEQSVNIST